MTVTETEPKPTSRFEFKRFTPEGFDGPPETPLQALLQAQALLFDEDRWMKSKWYQNEHPDVDPEDPYCNDWRVCAAGAVLMVTVGAARQTMEVKYDYDLEELITVPVEHPGQWNPVWCDVEGLVGPKRKDAPEYNIHDRAVEFLRRGTAGIHKSHCWSDVPAFNDSPWTTRTDVLKAFSKGIALAAKAEAEEKSAGAIAEAVDAAKTRVKAVLNNALEAV